MGVAALPGRLWAATDRHSGRLLAGGLVLVAAYNAWKWREDRALAERLRAGLARPRPALRATPKVSILVAAWNEAALIERHIQSVLALRYPEKEYVLCAGGSDGTYELARRYEGPGVVVLEQVAGEGKQRALRKGFARCSGEIIYLTDADCLLDDDSFERTIQPLVDGEAEAATGGSRPLEEQVDRSLLAAYRWCVDIYGAAHAPRGGRGLLGRNAAVARGALERAGGFGEDVCSGTDYHLAKSLLASGAAIRHVPASMVRTRYEETPLGYARRQRRWLRNVGLLGRRFGAHAEAAAALRTSLLGLGMLLGPAGAALAGRPALVLWLLALGHSVASKLRYLGFGTLLEPDLGRERVGAAAAAALPLTLLEFGVWTSPLPDYLVRGRRSAW